MTKLIGICTLIVIFSMSGFSQGDVKKDPNWTRFTPLEEPFSIETPLGFKTASSSDGSDKFYSGKINGTYFLISSEKRGKEWRVPSALNFIRQHLPTGNFEIVGPVGGEKFEFEDDEGYFHTALSFTLNGREYLFHSASRENGDELVKLFFKSLTIAIRTAPTPIDSSQEASNTSSIEPTGNVGAAISTGDRGSQSDGSGRSSCCDNNGGIGTGEPPPPADRTNSPVRILSKHRAPYTDIARQYNIQGSVTLKIIFLADGTVGKVTPQTFLPFGLTKSAIAAARSIKFEPKVVNETPVAVQMTFQYGFNLY